ncbi:MAG: universal stress protein [Fimbriimonadaceae bacterium]|nr:universal stress protein [Fimbriimonadaceae bacterium]QYK55914.1 MAG: universal stress protein [Fimbriimonadaceae bacterium]
MPKSVVMGIDLGGSCQPAMGLLKRIGYGDVHAYVVNSVEPVLSDGSFPELGATHPMADILTQLRENGLRATRQAVETLESMGFKAEGEVGFGDSVTVLRHAAEKKKADLIVVGFEHDDAFTAFLGGSVSRGLAMRSPCSLLIAKKDVPHDGPLNVVLATDHSDYTNRCIETLLEDRPTGIGKVTVVAVYRGPGGNLAGLDGDAMLKVSDAIGNLRQRVEEMNQALVERLKPWVADVDSVVLEGHANLKIRELAQERNADLIIVGAQGHGFLERLFVGSVAFDMVENAPQNLLLLRPRS